MKDTLLDLWDTFRYWVEDNKQTAAGIVVLIIFLVILVYVLLPKPEGSELVEGVKPYTIAEVEAMKEVSTELDNTFSLLRVLNEGSQDRKSTRLNSSHVAISYAVFCLKKKSLNYSEHL